MTSTNKVPVLSRFGGVLIWESNKVYYKGGTNRIVHIDQAINYFNFLSKLSRICKLTNISSMEYKYPGLDLDSLVSIENDDDVSNMMEAFSQSNKPIQLFLFCAQNLSISTAIPSNLMQSANNGNDQASLQELHGSNKTPAPSSCNTNANNNNNVPSASNDLREMKCLMMDHQALPSGVVDSSVHEMPKMMSVLKEDQEFVDAYAFHKSLREYAIRRNFKYKRTRSGGGHFQAKCIKDDCVWRIHAFKLPDKPTFKVKSLKENHKCNAANESTMLNTRTNRHASRKWIAALVKDRLKKNLRCKPKDIIDDISREYGIKVSYNKAWRGKELALKEMPLEQYIPDLRMLCKVIETRNPGSMAMLSRSSDNSLRLFVAYKAAICGFKKACRPLVMFDCIKIEGKCPGTWLFAMAIDAADDEFPVSCAFVESKNVGSWIWFCSELAQVLGCIPKLTLTSDRQEGILEVVSGIFPYAHHRYSQGRLVEEIWQKFKCWDLDRLFKSTIFARVHSEFDACMCQIHDKSIEAWNFVKDINPKHWATSHFEEKHYVCEAYYLDHTVNWNDKLEKWKYLPITSVLASLHDYMIETFNERFKKGSNWETILVPRAQNLICAAEIYSRRYSFSRSAAEFEVSFEGLAGTEKVDLEQRTCSCHYWQIRGYPCEHAIAAIQYSGSNMYDYIDVHYRVAKYQETYSEVIHPLHLPNKSLSPRKKRNYVDFEERRVH